MIGQHVSMGLQSNNDTILPTYTKGQEKKQKNKQSTSQPASIMADNSNPPRSSLRDHMAKFSGEAYVEGWAGLWNDKREDETLSWDRGCASVALEDVLTQRKDLLGDVFSCFIADNNNNSNNKHRRKRALVPGCGTGYDVLLIASFGYDTYGLDYSQVAVETAKKHAANNVDKYVVKDPSVGRGEVTFVQGDFFKDDWLESLGLGRDSFDLIYDYTVCINSISSPPP